jgi:hypothetical protein
MNNKSIIYNFINFESENKLFNLEIRTIKFWSLIRNPIYELITNQNKVIELAHGWNKKPTLKKKISLKLKQLKNIWKFNPYFYKKQKDFIILNHYRKVKNNIFFNCLYTDLINNEFQKSSVIIEEPYLEKHYKNMDNQEILYTDMINFQLEFYRFFTMFKFSEEEKETFLQVLKKINESFKTNISRKTFLNLVVKRILTYKFYRKTYKKLLIRIKPKIIIEVVSHLNSRFAINSVAKELGIPTVELQHGTMGKYHIAYNFKEISNISTFPDYVFTFGQFWKDTTSLPIKDENIKVVGWPYFEEKVKLNLKKEKIIKTHKIILFISQGTIGKDLSLKAAELAKIIPNNYKIIYKLHPGEYNKWSEEYPYLMNSRINVIDHNTYDMHHYFAQADVQVGVYSTAIFEGLAYYLPTYIFPFYGHEYLEELVEKKIVEIVLSAEKLLNLIMKDIKNYSNANITTMNSYLWSNDSLDKMIREVKTIVEK